MNRSLIRAQAFGDALEAGKLERIGHYEAYLGRTLAMLIRLRNLRGNSADL